MKIRSGFVSNSSSSSFVLAVTKDEYDKVRLSQDPLVQAVMDYTMSDTSILGQDCMLYENSTDNGGEGTFSYVDKDSIIDSAKKLAKAQGKPVSSDKNFPTDPAEQHSWMIGVIRESVYDVRDYFKSVPGNCKWSHSADW